MEYIAHIREKDGKIQTVREHLDEVRQLCEQFGGKIGLQHLAGLTGLLHDLGKSTEEFYDYIQAAVANPDNPPPRGSVDHSTAGGKLLYSKFYDDAQDPIVKLTVEWLAMCIISHHSGLRDFLSSDLTSPFLNRVKEKDIKEFDNARDTFFNVQIDESNFDDYFEKAKNEVVHLLKKFREDKLKPFTFSLIVKYIFSALIDADRTNTRVFEEDENEESAFDSDVFFEESYYSLMERITSFQVSEAASHPINQLRNEMSEQCEAFASHPSGIYTLSIPTGGGKTFASLRYALKHAVKYKKERIIYVVPYTTIIEQNAKEVRDILKNDEFILEHHSNVIEESGYENEDYDLKTKKLKLARDNWESPIIFTTMVQFLNVFYSRGTRNARRMHNLANSIVIFDEVQSVPIKCISLFNEALNFLNGFCNSSIVLCTATQPALDFVENKLHVSTDAEMIKDINLVNRSFKRVNIIDKTTPSGMNAPELTNFILTEMETVDNVLVILNTKTAVRKLFEELKEHKEYELFHLSTNMCPAHRKNILQRLKDSLSKKRRVICVSTQLIEAGVDISFQSVIRSIAGLDSIAQAAGRCNRHGEDVIRNVYIIKSADEILTKLREIRIGSEQTARVLEEFKGNPEMFGNDLLSQEAINIYFKYYYYQIQNELDYPIPTIEKNLFDLLNFNQDYFSAYFNKNNAKFPLISRQSFAIAEQYFQVIDSPTTSVLVPYNFEAREIISKLNGEVDSNELSSILKRAQQYIINVYSPELEELSKAKNIDLLFHGSVYALKEVAYSEAMGLDPKGNGIWSLEMY
ncbi:CRISPR-associated helicase/endonuclease Cas3 [Robertmurraya massiliosenegalensis]|uniref:CRISPR-associated helicase/endonuclease Cas3 n=1 Tax=Robertmurraya massiliosenegalensis TaxID=1287657 RepID=UPI0002F0182D|nr:CRISPR-associated helicase/endonuclease Cas3 [Robertmurraya massiliosenegalensis]